MSYGLESQQPGVEVPVCPRHPDRVSYVRCQRCGRPACPECQRTAAVGVQCVDCVAETSKQGRSAKTAYGATVRQGRPAVTIGILAACVVLFGLQLAVPGFTRDLQYAPVYTSRYASEPWRMISAAFLHSPGFIMHIAFNMYALWIMGRSLEPLLGRLRFMALYLLSAFGGSVGVLLLSDPRIAVVGASGAVFGLFGALFIVQRQRGGDIKGLAILIGINAVLGFVVPGIAWQAHLGGLLSGAAAAAVLAYAPRGPKRKLLQTTGLLVILGVLIVLTFVGAQSVRVLG